MLDGPSSFYQEHTIDSTDILLFLSVGVEYSQD